MKPLRFLPLFVLVSINTSVFSQTFRHEASLDYSDSTSTPLTGSSETTSLNYRYWLKPQDTEGDAPLAELPFLSQSGNVNLSYQNSDTDSVDFAPLQGTPVITPRPNTDYLFNGDLNGLVFGPDGVITGITPRPSLPPSYSEPVIIRYATSLPDTGTRQKRLGLAGQYVSTSSGWIAGAGVTEGSIDSFNDGDTEGFNFSAGKYLNATTRILLRYERQDTEFDTRTIDTCPGLPPGLNSIYCQEFSLMSAAETESLGIGMRHVGQMRNMWFALELDYQERRSENSTVQISSTSVIRSVNDNDSTFASGSFTLYPLRRTGLSLGFSQSSSNPGNIGESRNLRAGIEHYIDDMWAVSFFALISDVETPRAQPLAGFLQYPSTTPPVGVYYYPYSSSANYDRESYGVGIRGRF